MLGSNRACHASRGMRGLLVRAAPATASQRNMLDGVGAVGPEAARRIDREERVVKGESMSMPQFFDLLKKQAKAAAAKAAAASAGPAGVAGAVAAGAGLQAAQRVGSARVLCLCERSSPYYHTSVSEFCCLLKCAYRTACEPVCVCVCECVNISMDHWETEISALDYMNEMVRS